VDVVLPAGALDLRLPSPLQELHDDRLARAGVRLLLKRDDLISPDIPGNKWRKLKYNIEAARAQDHDLLLTFGGAYSNHVRATAAAGYHFGFSTVGVIRGEEHLPLNPTLAYAVSRGMRLMYLDRATYRNKASPDVVAALRERFGRFYLLPEGGSNELAARGCAEIPAEVGRDFRRDFGAVPAEVGRAFTVICCPCATGGTLAGIAQGLGEGQRALGFSVLKGGEFLQRQVADLQVLSFGAPSGNWSIEHGFHFGGFARRGPLLDQFIADFARRHGLELNWIYTAKMMYGIYALAGQPALPAGTTIVAVITG
jgi:1-aminocyclopropane-1-carboxylate deaminase/D-cysteine desulfhydrase-like pyridoxal-dependent ACC family enzyme